MIELEGTPQSMGEAFGARCRSAIGELYKARVLNAIQQARDYGGRQVDEAWLLEASRRCLSAVRRYHRPGFEELEGIARGSGLDIAQVWAMNALTDLRDLAAYRDTGEASRVAADGEGCTSIVVHGDRTATGHALLGQTWDLATDNMPFVCLVRRKPTYAPETLVLTTVGCLSLIGMNSRGIAVGTTNLRTVDVQFGVGYLDVIHRALSSESLDEARHAVLDAPRVGAHYYYLGDPSGRLLALECSAQRCCETPVLEGLKIQCNHAFDPENIRLEGENVPLESSHHRQERMATLASARDQLGVADLKRFFADEHGGPLAINRKDYAGISSNASVVMEPGSGRLWAVHGPADRGTWVERTVR